MRAFEAKATGHPSCRSAAPSPFCDASTCMVTGFSASKYHSVLSVQTLSFRASKASWYVMFQVNSVSFLRSSHRGGVCVESDGMNGDRYVIILRNRWSSCGSVGGGIKCIASTFFGSGWAPFLLYTVPKNVTEEAFTSHFSRLKTSPCSRATLISLCSRRSCSASSLPSTTMSSVIPMTPSQQVRSWSIIHWKMSWEQASPNGKHTNLYRPHGVLNVVRSEHS